MRKKRTHTFHCESLAELAGQLVRAPHDHQVQHLRRAEKLHDEMLADPDGTYPLAYVLFRITGLKAMYASGETLFARGVTHDLREIIDQLSKGLKQVADPADGCVDTQELARVKKVATRTIARWREDGLRWRWAHLEPGSYFQVVFPKSAVAAYEATHADKVAYATAFSQLTSAELRRLFQRAQRLAEATGAEPFTVARHIARRTGRATETLRLLLLRHDREDPDNAIFRNYTEPLTDAQKNDIFRAWEARTRTRELTRRFKRTRATIYRTVNEKRIERAKAAARPWHDMSTLARPDAATVFLSAPLAEFLPGNAETGPADLPAELRPFFTSLPPTEDAQSRLLLRHNYLNYQLDAAAKGAQGRLPRVREVERIEACAHEAQVCRAALMRTVLPLVHSMANRHLGSSLPAHLHENALVRLIHLSLPVLEEAVDAFDPGGKIPLSRYLSNRLLQRYSQLKSEPATGQAPGAELAALVRSRLERLTQTPG